MSHRFPRTFALAGLFAVASAAAATSSALGSPLQQTYSCELPLIDSAAMVVTTELTDPPSGTHVDAGPVSISGSDVAVTTSSPDAVSGLSSVAANSITGTATARWQVADTHAPRTVNVPLTPVSGTPLVGSFRAITPTVTVSQASPTATFSAVGLAMNLTARRADGSAVQFDPVPGVPQTDADPTTFDASCLADPTQPSVFGTITAEPTTTPSPTATVTPTPSPTPVPTPTATLPPTPTPPPIVVGLVYPYSTAGTATLKNLVKGSLPLTGAMDIVDLNLRTGTFTGDLTLEPTSANLVALGFLPVAAAVNIVSTDKLAGTFVSSAGALSATAKVRIKLPSIKVFGITLAGGTNCQAAQVSTIGLSSVGAFDVLVGGTLAGTFSISNLTGCGALSGVVSPLTSGSGNAITLQVTRRHDVS